MNESMLKMFESKLEVLSKRLKEKQFKVDIVDSSDDLVKLIKDVIPNESSVGLGGSKSIEECGLLNELHNMNINLIDRHKSGLSKQEIQETLRQGLLSDYFITSTNAISMDGA